MDNLNNNNLKLIWPFSILNGFLIPRLKSFFYSKKFFDRRHYAKKKSTFFAQTQTKRKYIRALTTYGTLALVDIFASHIVCLLDVVVFFISVVKNSYESRENHKLDCN